MTVKLRPARGKSGRFEYDIRFLWPDGSTFRERKNAPVDGKSAALRWAQAREGALLAAGKPAHVAKDTLAKFWPRVLREHYEANRRKPSTIETVGILFRLHLEPALGGKPLGQILTPEIAVLKGALAKYEPKTVNNILAVLSRILRCAVEWNVIPSMPRIGFLPVPEKEIPWYEVPVYRRLVDAARKIGTRELVLVLLGGSAGLRRGEIRALKWSDLDLPRKMIHVQRAFWRGTEGTTKGKKRRMVPMTPELHAALKAHRHLASERVLVDANNDAVKSWMSTAQKRAGLEPDGHLHVLRHTFCSHLAAAGAPAKAIQELAGHQDLQTTQRYMHLSPNDRGGAVASLARYYAENEHADEYNERVLG